MAQLGEIARLIEGSLEGPAEIEVHGAAGIDVASPHHITFAAEARYYPKAKATRAAAVIVGNDAPDLGRPVIRVANPRLAWARVLEFFDTPEELPPGIHETAVLGDGVRLGRDVSIGPYVVIGARVTLGDGVVLGPGCVIGDDVTIGQGTRFHPRVTVYRGTQIGRRVIVHSGTVIGSDGFGYVKVGHRHHKVPHIGNVIIEDDVELGASVTIDRGVCDSTVIGRGSKIDNLVQIGHNVQIGADCIIVSQVGIAGSTIVGDRVTLAGQSGVTGHLEIGSDSVIAARAVVAKDVPPGSFLSGYPARPHRESMKVIALTQRLPELSETLQALEREVRELQERLQHLEEEMPATGETR